jgi:hypothetical protein
MDNIVADNGYAIGSVAHLNMLYALAQEKAWRYRSTFNPDDYKWVLGVKVIHDLEISQHYSYIAKCAYENIVLFGIPVEVDVINPDNVQLWENITDKI